MNYSQKRTLVGRIVYIALTVMAVTVLCVTLYTFFGASKQNDTKVPVPDSAETDTPADSHKDETKPADDSKQTSIETAPPVIEPTDTSSEPTDVTPEKDWSSTKVSLPANGIISKGHDMKNAVYSLTMNDYRVHQGIDIQCSVGDEVIACADGVVKSVGNDPFMGTSVIIDHGDGLVSYYKNLAEDVAEDIEVGAEIKEGQIIGAVGETAMIEVSDEPHLHFELELDGNQIDPVSILEYDAEEASAVSANADN